jgi:hypothetical protein
VRPGFFILAAVLGPRPGLEAQVRDARLSEALPEITRAAAAFWRQAPDYVARETLNQKALTLPRRRLRAGSGAQEAPKPEFSHREIVSYYALSSFRASPEALHEFREIASVDGQALNPGRGARDKLTGEIRANDDKAKKTMLANFEKASLEVAATDFGQLILLFTKSNLAKYTFEVRGSALVGADRAMILNFHQNSGGEALRVAEPGKEVREPLTGQIWIREPGFAPLRITLETSRHERSKKIRDEARVDYEPKAGGMVLPVSVVYRRFVDDGLFVEAIYQYTDWQPVTSR